MASIERRDPEIDFTHLSQAELGRMQVAADDMIAVLEQAAAEGRHILIDILNSVVCRVDSAGFADISAASLVLVAPARGCLSWGKPQEDNALHSGPIGLRPKEGDQP